MKSNGVSATCTVAPIYESGVGFVGIGTMNPLYKLHVEADADNLPVVFGKNNNASSGTTAFGVRGECGAIGLGSAGVSGVSTNSGQNEIGTLGDYSLWGAAIFGMGWAGSYSDMPSAKDFGLFGTVNFSTGTGMYAKNGSSGANAIYGLGNFVIASGTKSASVPTTKGNQLLYCMESPEVWFEDFGNSKLINGAITINLDSLFIETIFTDETHPYKVFVQMEGDCKGLFVTNKTSMSFEVREIQSGTSDVEFSYRIIAKRKYYQDHRFGCDWMQPFGDNTSLGVYIKPYIVSPKDTQKWVESEKAKKEATVKKSNF